MPETGHAVATRGSPLLSSWQSRLRSLRDHVVRNQEQHGRRAAVGVGVAVFLLLGGLYAVGYALTSDRVPRGVSVMGVDIGGQRPEEAQQTLQRELVPRAGEPITVKHAGRTFSLRPHRVGLSLDVAATVRSAGGGQSLNPLRMIHTLTGGEEVEPVVDVDHTAMDKAVAHLSHKVERAPVEGSIRFRDGRATADYPKPGIRLDKAATAKTLGDAFLHQHAPVHLPVDRTPTRLNRKDIDVALSRFAKPAMSGPVTVTAGQRSVRVRPEQIGSALTMKAHDGGLVPRLDAQKLYRNAKTTLDPLVKQARPATVELRGGRPQVVSGQDGTKLDTHQLAQRIQKVLRNRGARARAVTIGVEKVAPAFDAADARDLGINEVVSQFTTYYPGDESYRNVNIGQAAENINGTVLKPGDVFSLNGVVGERTAANGFTEGYIIDNGMLVKDYGGGVSQVATTTYNAAFFAGMKDVEHNPHSIWFDRYPMGRESTVAWGSKDMRFQNNTPYGVLVQAWIKPSTPSTYGQMHVRMWSTHYWDVKAGLSDQYNFTKPSVRYDTSKQCLAETGYDGFDVDVYRYLSRNGHHVRTEKDHVSYDPLDTVHCYARPQRNDGSKAGSAASG